MDVRSQLGTSRTPEAVDLRRHPRFKLEVDIRVYPRDSAVVRGHTVDISESGISAMLREEVPLGEIVRLEFTLPLGAGGGSCDGASKKSLPLWLPVRGNELGKGRHRAHLPRACGGTALKTVLGLRCLVLGIGSWGAQRQNLGPNIPRCIPTNLTPSNDVRLRHDGSGSLPHSFDARLSAGIRPAGAAVRHGRGKVFGGR